MQIIKEGTLTKMGNEKEVEKTTKQPEEETSPETQTITHTQEELDALLVQAKEAGKQELEKQYKGIQNVVSKKDKRIEELEGQATQLPTSNPVVKGILDEIERQGREYGEGDTNAQARIASLRNQLAQEEAKQMQAKQVQYQENFSKQEREKLDKVITEAGLDPSDDMFTDVDEAFLMAKNYLGPEGFEIAHRKLTRILKNAKPPVKSKETEDKHKAEVDEAAREELEKRGLLKAPPGGPSGGAGKTYKSEEMLKTLDPSTMTPQEISQQVKELAKAEREGRIK